MSMLLSWLPPSDPSSDSDDQLEVPSSIKSRLKSPGDMAHRTPSPVRRPRSCSNQFKRGEISVGQYGPRTDVWRTSKNTLHSVDLPAFDAGHCIRRFSINKHGKLINLGDVIDRKHWIEPQCTARVAIFGTHGVGKSSLMNQFRTSTQFAMLMNEANRSGSVDGNQTMEVKVPILLGRVPVLMHFCDAAYTTYDNQILLTDTPTSQADSYAVMFSVTSTTTFEHAQKVYQALRANPRTCDKTIAIVANKIDLARRRVVTDENILKAFPNEAARHAIYRVSVAIDHGVDNLMIALLGDCISVDVDAVKELAHSSNDTELNGEPSTGVIVNRHGRYERESEINHEMSDLRLTSDEPLYNQLSRFLAARYKRELDGKMGLLRRVSTKCKRALTRFTHAAVSDRPEQS